MPRFIRILPKPHYFSGLGRFGSCAFKNFKGAISVIRESCISDSGASICNHLKRYYISVDEPPHVMWIFQRDILPDDVRLVQRRSDSGDDCHYDIEGLSDKKAKRIFAKHCHSITNLRICDNAHPRHMTEGDRRLLS